MPKDMPQDMLETLTRLITGQLHLEGPLLPILQAI